MQETIIAFDFGLKNIGVAIGQSLIGSASEYPPLPAKEGQPQWSQLQSLLDEWQPTRLVVGLPLNMDGTPTTITPRVKKFANRLHGRYGLPVSLMDERLTTREAKTEAQARGHHGHYASKPVDSIAARIILESWFREHTETKG